MIEDAGEKIGGARKDLWRERGLTIGDLDGMSEGEGAQHAKKDNVWKKPDYEAMVEGGMPIEVAALVKIVRDSMAAKPRNDTPEGRRDYVEMVGWVRDYLERANSIDDVRGIYDYIVEEKLGHRDTGLGSDPAARRKLLSVYKARQSPFFITHRQARRAKRMLEQGWPKKQTQAKRDKDTGELPKRPHLDTIERRGRDVRDGRNVTGQDFVDDFGFRGVEFGNWVASDERQKVVNLAYDGLHDMAELLGVPPKALSLRGTLGLAFGARGSGRAGRAL